jgi:GDPmannose 4,6-dehydratase
LIGDPTKAKKLLGWKAKTKFEDLVQMMIKSDMDKVLRRGY